MNRYAAALAAGLVMAVASVWAQTGSVAGAVSARSPESISQDLLALEASRQKLAEEEAGIMAALRSQNALPTNVVEAAAGDPELAAKMKRIKELQDELRQLQKEVMPRLASDPVLQERRKQLEKPRARLMEIHQERVSLDLKANALKDELNRLKPPDVPAK